MGCAETLFMGLNCCFTLSTRSSSCATKRPCSSARSRPPAVAGRRCGAGCAGPTAARKPAPPVAPDGRAFSMPEERNEPFANIEPQNLI